MRGIVGEMMGDVKVIPISKEYRENWGKIFKRKVGLTSREIADIVRENWNFQEEKEGVDA